MTIKEAENQTDYVTNYLCFIALSVEIFIILYVKEIVKNVTVVLFLDTFVLIGALLMAVYFHPPAQMNGLKRLTPEPLLLFLKRYAIIEMNYNFQK